MTTTHHLTDRAIFVTTARYTRPAAELARLHSIELWDGQQLADLLSKHRGEAHAAGDQPGFQALEKASSRLSRKRDREAKRATADSARQAQEQYEGSSSLGIHVPDAALDLARQSAAVRALRRRNPDHEPTENEIDELVLLGSSKQAAKRCEECGFKMPWYEQLPGHYCPRCGRIELWIADERKVLSPRSRKRARRLRRW